MMEDHVDFQEHIFGQTVSKILSIMGSDSELQKEIWKLEALEFLLKM